MAMFNGEELTNESILKCRKLFADNKLSCIEEVLSGAVRVNDTTKYFAQCIDGAIASMVGDYDHTFTFLQRAYYIQTGKCIALLP